MRNRDVTIRSFVSPVFFFVFRFNFFWNKKIKRNNPHQPKRLSGKAKWVGLPLKISDSGDIFYSTVAIGNHLYKIGT